MKIKWLYLRTKLNVMIILYYIIVLLAETGLELKKTTER